MNVIKQSSYTVESQNEIWEILREILTGVRSTQEVVFWSGAGISRDAPTCAPQGREMTARLLQRYFQPGVLETLQHYYSALDIGDLNSGEIRVLPRFESILQVIVDEFGKSELDKALSPLRQGTPNQNHAFFASHLRAGGSHITANLDGYIEAAGQEEECQRLLHFHGTSGATFESIESGFLPNIVDSLERRLSAPAKLLVLCGYSGSDYFDVDPFLRSFTNRDLSGLTVIWIGHDISTLIASHVGKGGTGIPRQLDWFANAGADCWHIRGDTSKILKEIGAPLDLSMSYQDETEEINPWWINEAPPESARQRATTRLYSSFGIVAEVLAQRDVSIGSTTFRNQLAQALWHKGKYREALREWRKGNPGWTIDAFYKRWERQIAVDQVRGRFIRSQLQIFMADYFFRNFGQMTQTDTWSLDQHRAKGLSAMKQMPLLKLFVTDKRLKRAVSKIESARRSASGMHASIRLAGEEIALRNLLSASSRRQMRNEDGIAGQKDEETFDEQLSEAESISGVLNYRHRRLHVMLANPDRRVDLSPQKMEEMLLTHIGHQLILGMDGDAARSAVLPNAFTILSRIRVKELLARSDITRVHRIRLLTWDWLHRIGSTFRVP